MMKYFSLFFLLISCCQLVAQELQVNDTLRFLSLGDSYTIGESVPSTERWPVQLGDSLAIRNHVVDTSRIIATTGWTTTNLLNAISGQNLEGEQYNLVGLLIGVNNQFQNQPVPLYKTEFKQLLDSAIRYAGDDTNRVFVVSIPDYAYTPAGQTFPNPQQISDEIDLYNHINDSITADHGIVYFNITPISRNGLMDTALVANDGLHPSGKQYTEWVKLMLQHIDSIAAIDTTTTDTTVNDTATGLFDLQRVKTLQIYPIPAKEQLTVAWNLPFKIDQLTILDIVGRTVNVESIQLHEKKAQLYTGTLIHGKYFLRVKSNDGIVEHKSFLIE